VNEPSPPTPYAALGREAAPPPAERAAIGASTRIAEPDAVEALLAAATLSPGEGAAAHALARRLVESLRARRVEAGREGLVQGLIQEFALSSQEGVALMCLAEALLRIPDAATRDALIRDKIGDGEWERHLGKSPSLFVNAATWGLVVTGKLVATHTERGLAAALGRLVARSGEPVIRRGVDLAMRLMGEQFVMGETIDAALARAAPHERAGFRYSYDMLGEAALTADDAVRYLEAYRQAIDAIGAAAAGRGFVEGPGISIKLSALHPRYARAQRERVHAELYPRLLALAQQACAHDLGLNIDAEEADRLEISIELLERLCADASLAGWNGVGFVVQAYQKRCAAVIEHVVALARRNRRRLMVRLVKGAYWDSEIKRAQLDGQPGYPVFTRKPHTDVSYLAAARRLLDAPDAIYPQFATHNAHTLAAVHAMAGPDAPAERYEFQCLHGMGEALYEPVVAPRERGGLARPCRIYAPVGTHETLLAYLVRRLLENGANTSFVNRIGDRAVPVDELIADPVGTTRALAAETGRVGAPHPAIPLPADLYAPLRRNSCGADLADDAVLAALRHHLVQAASRPARAVPLVAGDARDAGEAQPVRNPGDRRDVVGHVVEASARDLADALAAAQAAAARWAATPVPARAAMLERAADALEAGRASLIDLAVREAGKTLQNAIGELREAVDFLRYDAAEARRLWSATATPPEPIGPVVCISPWNFPLAIFTGQVAAALVAGNPVIAKPAEQTPLIAAAAVRALHAAGVPGDVLQFLPGRGETVGAALVADGRVRGVLFTGSNAVASLLQRALAGRVDARGELPVLVAETGGQNAMIVDSSALAEQVVSDVLASAFDSAGQRCSALRVLCLQDEIAEHTLAMLLGAMRELRLGPTDRLSTDVGPVIDAPARTAIEAHIEAMRSSGRRVHQPLPIDLALVAHGDYVAPALIELARIDELAGEVFGPVLHVIRYARRDLAAVVDAVNATGYGLTLGVHTRIDETIDAVNARIRAGNAYVNRNMVGAVVGVQPFGGEGLSGTGPKAGGPLYLPRLVRAPRGGAATRGRTHSAAAAPAPVLAAFIAWCERAAGPLAAAAQSLAMRAPSPQAVVLAGPTGERNTWRLVPRQRVLCFGSTRETLLLELAIVLAAGSEVAWLDDARARELRASLPGVVQAAIVLVADVATAPVDAALAPAGDPELADLSVALAARAGAIVGLHTMAPEPAVAAATFPLERLMLERTLSVNTAAAGGNASLMTIG
jgi:RHH-type proline utilization regulon transcriptional repressor/proline dehydrogenase/delta 1-pyrroline-5-carboxylate dehydrogenase